jgi:hypothetical protein
VLADVGTQPRHRGFALVVGLGVAIGRDGFQRKFGIDHQVTPVGHEYAAVRTGAVRQRVLEFIGPLRQAILHDRFHAPLAECTARLFVAEHGLQRGDLGCEVGDVFLGAVDDGQTLVELLQVLGCAQLGFLKRIAEPVRNRIEPLIDRVLQLGLAAGEHADHGFEPRRGIDLRAGQFGHDSGLRIRAIARPPEHHGENDKRRAPDKYGR